MDSSDHWKGVSPLSQDISTASDGKYSIACSEKRELSSDDSGYQYSKWFQTPPLDPTAIERLRGLQLAAESHDQGYCDGPSSGNWTWFELAIMENERSDTPRVKDGIQLAWLSHVNRFCTEEYGWKAGKTFPSDHDIFRLIEDGNVVAVRLCTRFAGWQMYASAGYLLIEIGAPVNRPPLSFGLIATQTKAVQEAFLEVNNALLPDPKNQIHAVPDELLQAEMLTSARDRPLRVLALDGGGVRGVAALMLLDAVMKKVAPNKKPCEVFDLIGGTSTGGFIAIMLGRFKMSIDECLTKYKDTMKTVFPKSAFYFGAGAKYDAKPLETVIKSLTKEKLGSEDATLMDEQSQKDSCKVFVMATKQTGANNSAPAFFRSYRNPLEMSEFPEIKLWQAARATSAAPTYFNPLTVNGASFLDGGLQANNPLGWLWNEILNLYGPARATNCFLSIGTGVPLKESMSNWVVGAAETTASIATNSDITNILFRSLINAFAPQGVTKKYWRFNVGDGLPDWVEEKGQWTWKLLGVRHEEDIGKLDDVGAIQKTEDRARAYLSTPAADKMVTEAAEALKKQLN